MKKNIILLSTADWDNPFWTNKQHVTVELANQGFNIFYIDSLGLRAPSATKGDMTRIFKRLRKALAAPIKKQEGVWVWSPIILPWHKYKIIRKINKIYLNFLLNFFVKKLKMEMKESILWTYNPLTTRLLNLKQFKTVIYHCVDEIKEQPSMPSEIIDKAEIELLNEADFVFVTSENLYESRKSVNKNTYYHSNVSDFSHFNKALTNNYDLPSDLKGIHGTKLGFIGAISNYKVDFDLLEYVAKKRPNYQIILIGGVGEGDPGTSVEQINKYKNIHIIGPKSYDSLPQYLSFMDVALLPNKINRYTDNMFPMKFFEYLSAGCSVVGVNLKSLQSFKDCFYLSQDYETFLDNIDRVANGDVVPLNTRLTLAKEFTYETRTKKMLDIINSKRV